MEQIKVLLVEDREIIRDGIKYLLRNTDEVKIIAEAEDGLQALFYAKNIDYNIILMDYCMPEMNGREALKQILEINPNAKIIMFSFLNNHFEIEDLLSLGASGYILKDSEITTYIDAIKCVNMGSKYLCEKTKLLLSKDLKAS